VSEKATSNQLENPSRVLHQRVLDGDVTAPAEVAEAFMPLTINRLRRQYHNLHDPHLIDTAVEDALVNYFNRPQQYDPAKSSLASYLYMSARYDLLNLLERDKRYTEHLRLAEYVELDNSKTEHGVEIQDEFNLEALILSLNSPVWQRLSDLLPDPVDQEIVLLMMEGVRKTSVFADVLGISDHSVEEQAAIVKRHKDRLKKKLQRSIQRSELRDND
jgi:DNA-directed RNA polymerase specialized sigma24 family protein